MKLALGLSFCEHLKMSEKCQKIINKTPEKTAVTRF